MTPSFDDLKRTFGFSEADTAALRSFLSVARPHLEAIADQFYDRIERHSATRELLGGQTRIPHLKTTLIAWMESTLAGPHDQRYFDHRARIGQMHVRAGLPQPYILATMNLIRRRFHELTDALPPRAEDGTDAAVVRDAIDKIIDLELAIMLDSYSQDAEDRLRESERHRLVQELQSTGALATGLAHELRNPLNSTCLQLRVLDGRLRRAKADARLREPLALAQADVERLSRLLDDVLALAEPRESNCIARAPLAGPADERDATGNGTP
jgi:two-component system, NtrC family, sensor histidine kinase HydH